MKFQKLSEYVKLFAGKSMGRERVLVDLLEMLEIPYSVHKYHHEHEEHHNYLFSLGRKEFDESGLLLTAHYDTFPDSPGANDNASAIAVLIGLYQELRKSDLQKKITFAIFDQEENGCVGSRAFAKHNYDFSSVISLELVGHGDVIGLWPITEETKNQSFCKELIATIKKKHITYEVVADLPLFYADFTPFREKSIKDSFCITVVPKEDLITIRKVIKHPNLLKKHSPKFFEHYHSKKDDMSMIQDSALSMAANVLYEIITKP